MAPHLVLRYAQNVEKMLQIYGRQRSKTTGMPTVRIFVGAPGTGKTHAAIDEANAYEATASGDDDAEAYVLSSTSKWFPQYYSYYAAVFDEFSGSSMPWNRLLLLCDRNKTYVEGKGTNTPFAAEHITLTSMNPPYTWYTDTNAWLGLARRITEFRIYHPGDVGVYTQVLQVPDSHGRMYSNESGEDVRKRFTAAYEEIYPSFTLTEQQQNDEAESLRLLRRPNEPRSSRVPRDVITLDHPQDPLRDVVSHLERVAAIETRPDQAIRVRRVRT